MIYIQWSQHDRQMKIIEDDTVWYATVSCVVRNELNGWRPLPYKDPADEIVRAITEENILTDIPVMPRPFPVGKWEITSVEDRHDKYRKPFLILTDAFQELDEWELTPEGGYDKPSGLKVKDYQYGIHFSESSTTQGCIKVHEIGDLVRLVQSCCREFDQGETPVIEVVT